MINIVILIFMVTIIKSPALYRYKYRETYIQTLPIQTSIVYTLTKIPLRLRSYDLVINRKTMYNNYLFKTIQF